MTTPARPQRPDLRLCPSCMVNLGYWTDEQGYCPTCAAISREAGE
jgi:hypothetical protein